ncbi:MAG: tetratricopeptide repeat protein [Desulfobacteraceae bacterium]|jgi:tetratricopeptide (TPR) repeat protein
MQTGNFIFISHAEGGYALARKLTRALNEADFNIWNEGRCAGSGSYSMADEQKAIDCCSHLLAVLTEDYLASGRCNNHFARARSLDKSIVAVVAERLETTRSSLFQFDDFSMVDLIGWREDIEFKRTASQVALELLSKEQKALLSDKCVHIDQFIRKLENHRGVKEYVKLFTKIGDAAFTKAPQQSILPEGYGLLTPKHRRKTGYKEAGEGDRQILIEQIDKVTAACTCFVLLGEPGSGKSTTLRRLARDAALKWREAPFFEPFPLLIELGGWRDNPSPEMLIEKHWQFAEDIHSLLKNGRVRLYLDALDEIIIHQRQKAKDLRKWILNGNARFLVVSCRSDHYIGELQLGLPSADMQALNNLQIEEFAHRYLQASADDFLSIVMPTEEPNSDAERQQLRLLQNPYLLGALIHLYERSGIGELPSNSGQLFKTLTRALWARELERSRPDWCRSEKTFEEKYSEMANVLGRLAFNMLDENIQVMEEQWVLQQLSGQAFWRPLETGTVPSSLDLLKLAHDANLVEFKDGQIRFYHFSMKEFFAAFRLAQESSSGRLEVPPVVQYGVDDDGEEVFYRYPGKWDQVVIALCGIVNANSVVSHLNRFNPYLAAQCIASGADVAPQIRNQTIDILLKALQTPKIEDSKWTGLDYLNTASQISDENELESQLSSFIRIWSAKALSMIGPAVADDLLMLTGDNDAAIRLQALEALRDIGPKILPMIIHTLSNGLKEVVSRDVQTNVLESFYIRHQSAWIKEIQRLSLEHVMFCADSVITALIPADGSDLDPLFEWQSILERDGVDKDRTDILASISAHRPEALDQLKNNYRQDANLDPGDPDHFLRLIILGLVHENIDAARRAYHEALQLSCVDADMHLKTGIWFHRYQNHVDALDAFSRALQVDPQNYHARVFKAVVHLKQALSENRHTEVEAAAAEFSEAMQIAPENSMLYLFRGDAYHLLRVYGKAIEDYTTYIKNHPEDYNGYFLRGTVYAAEKRPVLAIEDFSCAIAHCPDNGELYWKRSDEFFRLFMYNDAIADLSTVIQHQPENIKARAIRGKLYEAVGNLKAAIADYSHAIQNDDQIPDLFRYRALAYSRLGLDLSAIEDLKAACAIVPHDLELYQLRMATYMRMGALDAAFADLRRILLSRQNDFRFLSDIHKLCQYMDTADQAIAHISDLIENHPDSAGLYFARGIMFSHQTGDVQSAAEDFQCAINLKSDAPYPYIKRAALYMDKNQYEAAIPDLEKLRTITPSDAEIIRLLASAYILVGNYSAAINDLNKAIQQKDNDPALYVYRARAYQGLQKYQKALKDLQRARSCDPSAGSYLAARIQVYAASNDIETALADIVVSIEKRLDQPGFLAQIPELYRAIGRLDSAPGHVSALIKKHPDSAGAYFVRGLLYNFGPGPAEKANEDYSKAIALNPMVAEFYQYRAVLYHLQKRLEDAIADYNRILNLKPDSLEALLYRGILLLSIGRYKAALVVFSRALQLDPRSPLLLSYRAEVYSRLEIYHKALEDLENACRLDPDQMDYHLHRMRIYRQLDDQDGAMNAIRQTLTAQRENYSFLADAMRLYEAVGKLSQSPAHLSTLIDEHPKCAGLYFARATAYFMGTGDPRKAIKDIGEAISLKDDIALFYSVKGDMHYFLGDLQAAIESYASGIELKENDPVIYYRKAQYERCFLQNESALRDCAIALKLSSQDPLYHAGHGHVLADLENFQGALESYTHAIGYDDRNGELYHFRALAFLDMGDLDAAFADLKIAEDMTSSNEVFICYSKLWVSLVYLLNGQENRFNQYHREAVSLTDAVSDTVEKSRLLALLSILMGNDQRARQHCEDILTGMPAVHHIVMHLSHLRRLKRLLTNQSDVCTLVEWFESRVCTPSTESTDIRSSG